MKRYYLYILLVVLLPISLFAWSARIEQLKTQLAQTEDASKKISLMCEISFEYLSSNVDSGMYFATTALSLANATNNFRGIVLSKIRLGILYETKGKFDSASIMFSGALELGEKIQEKDIIVEAYNFLGNYNININRDKALEYQLKALKLSEEIHSNQGIAATLNNIGNIYLVTQNYDKALEYFLQSRAAWKSIGHHNMTGILSDIGNAYYYKQKYDSAYTYYLASFKSNQEYHDKQGMGYSLGNLGLVYMKTGEYAKALDAFKLSLLYREEVNNAVGISNGLLNLSDYYKTVGTINKALEYALRNYALIQKFKNNFFLAQATGVLVQLYTIKKEYKTALQYQHIYVTIKDSLSNEDQQRHLAQLELLYEMKQREVENKYLMENQAKQEVIIKQQTILAISFSALFFIAFTFALLLYKSNKAKQKTNTLLNEQNAIVEQHKMQLEELHTVKDKLFSVVTHDLQNPLTSLSMLLTRMSEEELSHEELKEYITNALMSSNNLVLLLNNILHWSKGQWYEFQVRPETFSIFALAAEKIYLSSTAIKHKYITIENTIPEGLEIHADLNMIDMVLRNLISNAIKFTPQNGTITLQGSVQHNFAHITVRDSGRGMSVQQQQALFSMQTLSTTGTDYETGTGIGLVLSKEYIEKNGGTIRVQSELGKGSAFTFTVPLGK